MKTPTLVFSLIIFSLFASVMMEAAELPAPQIDTKKIINESYNFKKNQEPEMTMEEYALYEKVVAMVAFKPDFALRLLETMTGGNEKTSPAFDFVLANVYFANNRYELAETHFHHALTKFPGFTRAWANLGSLLYTVHRYSEASDCFSKTVASGDHDAQTLGVLAYCLAKTGRMMSAEMNYIQAIALDPDNPDYLGGLLSLYLDAKEYPRAESILRQMIRVKPGDSHNWNVYGSILAAQDRKLEAIGLLEGAAGQKYLDEDGLLLLSDLYSSQKFFPEAQETLTRLKARSPELGSTRMLAFIRGLIAGKKADAAESALAAYGQPRSPEDQKTLLQLRTDLYISKASWKQAREQVDNLLERDPLNGPALFASGVIFKAEGDLTHAELAFNQASQVKETSYRSTLEIADIAIKTKRYDRGIEYLEKASTMEKSPAIESYIARLKLIVPHHED